MRRAIAAAMLICVTPLAASCGFTPIYAKLDRENAPLENISISSHGKERVDFLFERAMADKLGAYTPSGDYKLETVVTQTRLGFGLRVDDVATRYESTVTAQYRLIRVSDNAVVLQGARAGVSSYDVTSDPYAELSSEQASIERAVELAAEKVRLDLTLYFANLSKDT